MTGSGDLDGCATRHRGTGAIGRDGMRRIRVGDIEITGCMCMCIIAIIPDAVIVMPSPLMCRRPVCVTTAAGQTMHKPIPVAISLPEQV